MHETEVYSAKSVTTGVQGNQNFLIFNSDEQSAKFYDWFFNKKGLKNFIKWYNKQEKKK